MSDGSLHSDLGHKVSMFLELQSAHSSEVRFGWVLLWLFLFVLLFVSHRTKTLLWRDQCLTSKWPKRFRKAQKYTRPGTMTWVSPIFTDLIKLYMNSPRFDFTALLLLSTYVKQSRIWKESRSQGPGLRAKVCTYCSSYWRGHMVRLHLKMQSQE